MFQKLYTYQIMAADPGPRRKNWGKTIHIIRPVTGPAPGGKYKSVLFRY